MGITAELGRRIRRYRKEARMTQEVLSKQCNLHPTYIGQIERGEKNPSVDSVYKICKALGVSMSKLFEKLDDIDDIDESDEMKVFDIVSHMNSADQKYMLQIAKACSRLGRER